MTETPTTAEVSESCRCGGSTSVKAGSMATALRHVEQWRTVHPCTSQQQELDGMRSGTTSTFLGGPANAPVGFRSVPEVDGPGGRRG
jgi:hypothetical protein